MRIANSQEPVAGGDIGRDNVDRDEDDLVDFLALSLKPFGCKECCDVFDRGVDRDDGIQLLCLQHINTTLGNEKDCNLQNDRTRILMCS